MSFVLPEGLPPEVYPLAWLLGSWDGLGVVEYPGVPRATFSQRVTFANDGGPYLGYSSTLTLLRDDDAPGQVWSSESGYWRVAPSAPKGVVLDHGKRPLEVVLADAAGFASVYLGAIGGGRIDLTSDVVVRTASAPEVAEASRMYGLVEGDLLWAWDIAAFGNDLQSYVSARLSRVRTPD